MPQNNAELADFLRRARGAVDPARSGLPADGRVRRVPGLRREEVAVLAGVSTDYYARLEQGRPILPSDAVIDAIARALALDETARAHLHHLIDGPRATGRPQTAAQRVRPGLWQLLDSLEAQPALILGRRSDILASNAPARALFADFDRMPPRQRNYARWMFLDPRARELFVDWEEQARSAAESLRLDLGARPGDAASLALIEELTDRSAEFTEWWTQHRVYQRTYGSKRLRHPIAGELTVDYETFEMPGDADQRLFVYSTPPGTAHRQAMDLLVSWTLADRRPSTSEAERPREGR